MIRKQGVGAFPTLTLLFVALVVLTGSGCASIVKGSTQSIPVASDPSAADVLVDGNLSGETPTNVELKRKHDHLITIQKTGFRPRSVPVVKAVGGAVFGNILAGGLIGWGVDAATGAQYNLIPKTISVQLEPLTAPVSQQAADDPSVFVSKLKALDLMHENKSISDEEYGKGRLELFKRYMPEAIPKDAEKKPESTTSPH